MRVRHYNPTEKLHDGRAQPIQAQAHANGNFVYVLQATGAIHIYGVDNSAKPAARTIGLPWVNWRSLRTSHAIWLKLAGADVEDAQGQMRHSRASTTLDICQQFVPESQRRLVDRLTNLIQ